MDEQNILFESVFDNSINEIYIFDANELTFIKVNRGAQQNLGYTMEELRSLTAYDIKPEFSLEIFRETAEPLVSGDVESLIFTTIHERRDGSTYPVEVHLQYDSSQSHLQGYIIRRKTTLRAQGLV